MGKVSVNASLAMGLGGGRTGALTIFLLIAVREYSKIRGSEDISFRAVISEGSVPEGGKETPTIYHIGGEDERVRYGSRDCDTSGGRVKANSEFS